MRKIGEIGAAKYLPGGGTLVIAGQYAGGELALRVLTPGGEPALTATVNLVGNPPKDGHVWLKGWSENEGLPEAIAAAGLVELTGETAPTGRVEAQEARLLFEVDHG